MTCYVLLEEGLFNCAIRLFKVHYFALTYLQGDEAEDRVVTKKGGRA